MTVEIGNLVKIDCKGTKNDSPETSQVTVDVTTLGERRVGCPFLRGLRSPVNDQEVLFLCTIPTSRNNTLSFEQDVRTAREIVRNTPKEEIPVSWNSCTQTLLRNYPLCIHKNPS